MKRYGEEEEEDCNEAEKWEIIEKKQKRKEGLEGFREKKEGLELSREEWKDWIKAEKKGNIGRMQRQT